MTCFLGSLCVTCSSTSTRRPWAMWSCSALRKISILWGTSIAGWARSSTSAFWFGLVCYLFLNGERGGEYMSLSHAAWDNRIVVWSGRWHQTVPSNLLMQKFKINQYLGANIFAWGVFLMLQACAKNFWQLAFLRAISGAAEVSLLFSGANFIILDFLRVLCCWVIVSRNVRQWDLLEFI